MLIFDELIDELTQSEGEHVERDTRKYGASNKLMGARWREGASALNVAIDRCISIVGEGSSVTPDSSSSSGCTLQRYALHRLFYGHVDAPRVGVAHFPLLTIDETGTEADEAEEQGNGNDAAIRSVVHRLVALLRPVYELVSR